MSTVAERDDRVHAYLDELEQALRILPAPQARELTEQITAHLDEALPPGSRDETVVAVLRRLGSPAKLAAEAQTAGLEAQALEPAVPGSPRRRFRNRFGPRGWGAIAAGLVLACLLATWLGLYLTTPILTVSGSSSWLYPQDEARSVYSSTLGAFATTVPGRPGQRQGFVIEVENPSNSAQTVLGIASSTESPTGLVGMGGITDVTVAVSTFANDTGASYGYQNLPFTAQATIQPGQYRFLKVTWLTDSCSLSGGDFTTGSDQLDLNVQIGWFSREEDITLLPGWQLSFGSECDS
jgi:hypothetical protein